MKVTIHKLIINIIYIIKITPKLKPITLFKEFECHDRQHLFQSNIVCAICKLTRLSAIPHEQRRKAVYIDFFLLNIHKHYRIHPTVMIKHQFLRHMMNTIVLITIVFYVISFLLSFFFIS